jgi:hypothetical protein|tara:strand:+ start:436 stop:1152 length:717 start_codon:yes stop_codon:yes gene_type:complete
MEQYKQPEVKTAENIENEAVDSKVTPSNTSQEEVSTPKTFTQSEFNDAMASVRKKAEANVLKKFDGVDVDKYRALLTQEEEKVLEEQKKRGEFEKILKDTAEKKDQRIAQLHTQLNSIKVDDALLQSSAKYKAINPAQVSQLIKGQVKLNDAGDVEVVDQNGAPRYAESGEPFSVENLVKEFLDTNPHFISAGPSGSGAKSNTASTGIGTVDIASLDMNKPEDRAIYAEYRKKHGIVS